MIYILIVATGFSRRFFGSMSNVRGNTTGNQPG